MPGAAPVRDRESRVGPFQLPGHDPLGVSGMVVLGLVGSFLGGVMAWLFIGHPAGLVFSVIGAVALLYTRRRFVEHR